jgi:histone-lysine N-methyltransferase SETMAR
VLRSTLPRKIASDGQSLDTYQLYAAFSSSLKIGRAKDESEKGFFCAATRPLQKGAFVSLYAGELLSKRTSNERRGKRKLEHPDWGNYILALKENGKTLGMVDATQTGNIGSVTLSSKAILRDFDRRSAVYSRFLNHSCDPNCVIQLVRWGPRAFPRPAIFVSIESCS